MAFEPARPRHTLELAGKEYELIGDLALVEAVENSLREGIVHISIRMLDMGVMDTARVLAAMLTTSGEKTTPREMADLLFNKIGINTAAFRLVQSELYIFIRVLLEPPELREQMAKKMGELRGKPKSPAPSPGDNTKNSA